jgi:hypothetical protein
METVLSLCIGIGLSAACGFRVFVPLLLMSIASHSGHLSLAPAFQWIGSEPALIAFGVATVLDLGGHCGRGSRRIDSRRNRSYSGSFLSGHGWIGQPALCHCRTGGINYHFYYGGVRSYSNDRIDWPCAVLLGPETSAASVAKRRLAKSAQAPSTF